MVTGTGGFSIEIDIFGDKQLAREIMRVGQRGRDMRPPFHAIANDFFGRIERLQFDTQGRYASGYWPGLAASTLARKIALGQDLRILHATLALRNSLTIPGAPGQIRRITHDELVVGTNVRSRKGFPYPAVHQNPKSSPLPRRRPIELTAADRSRWIKTLQRYLLTGDVGAVSANRSFKAF